ncbi:hypothetical protein PENSPDRAFT_611203 [Peniophora sp. CONT]|nr:hypothetical protein PENSPDRAFT_611203 [Peniophora sp. CONT]
MPVSFHPASHRAKSVTDVTPLDAASLLERSTGVEAKEILQSFLGRGPTADAEAPLMHPASGGLVTTVINAYNRHYALVLRPDDVWLAILTQFSFFVNGPGRAEELRSRFVAHEGKKEITVTAVGTRYSVDFGALAKNMTREMEKHIVDPEIRGWILPGFSTTTPNDTVVASVVMMATMKAYFDYKMMLMCGIPRVTLLGEKADWEDIARRAEKLQMYGKECEMWYKMLAPVLTQFVRAFDAPDAKENLEFWQKVAHYQGGGSGPTWLSGWITVFCAFDKEGKWLGLPPDEKHTGGSMEAIEQEVQRNSFSKPRTVLVLDGAAYHVLDSSDIPSGNVEVDVKLDDNGKIFDTTMVAGIVASRIDSSGDQALSESGRNDIVAPMPGWWIFIKEEEKEGIF